MTEEEWLNCEDPTPMLEFLKGKVSERKLRLFAVACCRRVWHSLDEDVSRPGVEVIERYADGLATSHELEKAHRTARAQGKNFEKLCAWRRNTRGTSPEANLYQSESEQAYLVSYASQREDYLWWVLTSTTQCKLRAVVAIRPGQYSSANEEWDRLCAADRAELADLVRDIFGNPFGPVTLNLSWLTSTVIALACGIYTDRAFDRMPILADALQDAGCENAAILDHCRDPKGVHVRGCFVVDMILDKA